jgi:hypothetical protein|nr:MAG TPA: Structural protein [Caudoviricetes sp.]
MTFDSVDDVLAHFGVKGMKWGVRKKRPSVSKSRKTNQHGDYKHAHSKTPNHKLSNKELQRRVTRLNLEKQYRDLTAKPQSKYRKKLGEKYAENFANVTMKIAGAAAGAAAGYAVKALLDKAVSGGFDAASAEKISNGFNTIRKFVK